MNPSHINSDTIPLDIFKNYINNKSLHIPEISKEDNEYINNNIKNILVYTRDNNAFKCYSCKTQNIQNLPNCCICNTNLSPTDLSITSAIIKK